MRLPVGTPVFPKLPKKFSKSTTPNPPTLNPLSVPPFPSGSKLLGVPLKVNPEPEAIVTDPVTVNEPDWLNEPVDEVDPVIAMVDPCRVIGTLLLGLPTWKELVDISNKETSDTLWITLPGTVDFICTNVLSSPACITCFEALVLILLPPFRSSKSVLENDVPPILIVFASTSTTEAVIYWNEPELAVTSPVTLKFVATKSPEAVKCPPVGSIVTVLLVALEPL
jgi:hypothetical protein